jgi:CheY-like chemotaxis protein
MIRQLAGLVASELCECGCGAEALRLARSFAPDLVTMDVRLPDLSGIEVTAQLRTACPAARVIVVTAFDQPAMREAARAAGAVHFLAKENLAGLPTVLAHLRQRAGATQCSTGGAVT